MIIHLRNWGNAVIAPIFFLTLVGCRQYNHFVKTSYQYRPVQNDSLLDTRVAASIVPYKNQVDSAMNAVIGTSAQQLTKAQPESSLGNFVADALLHQANLYTKSEADLTIVNHGGLRISALPKGNLTQGVIFELLPFDNTVVVLTLTGAQLEQLIRHSGKKGGWPISKSVKIMVKGVEITRIFINGQPLDSQRTYRVVTNDYLANGGDDCSFLANTPRVETGVVIRDAITQYISELHRQGKSIDASVDGRIQFE